MGFLQKFFSLGGKRSKRQWRQQQAEQFVDAAPPPLPVAPRNQEDHEATVNRLLRSSSANLAAMDEVEEVARLSLSTQRTSGTSTMSTTSLASTSQRGSYTVIVHPRTVIAPAQFPNANPDAPHTPHHPKQDSLRRRSKSLPMNNITPKDKARLLGLRADPSVASLLNIYDDHGCLDPKLFSNSPSPRKEGRVQTQRTGSTLRELLGGPSSMNSRKGHDMNTTAMEGDISWAERWLCESANTSTSSLIQTPNDTHFNHNYLNNALSESQDFTINQSDLCPVFSSLEVELSMPTEGTIRTPTKFANNPYTNEHYPTPHRASEIFDFLTAKKSRPRAHSQPEERSFSFERGQTLLAEPVQATSRFSAYSSAESRASDKYPDSDTSTDVSPELAEPETPAVVENVPNWPSSSNWIQHHATAKKFRQAPEDNSMACDGPKLHQVVIKSGAEAQSNRVRGPRPPPRSDNNPSANPTDYEPASGTQPHPPPKRNTDDVFQSECATASAPDLSMAIDVNTFSPGPMRPSHRNTASRTSAVFPHVPAPAAQKPATMEAPYIPKQIRRKQPPSKWAHMHTQHTHNKENNGGARDLPTTPVRSSILRPALGTPPSSVSSSDLSPVARQLMADLRSQRMAARPRYKRPNTNSGKWSTSTSKLKF